MIVVVPADPGSLDPHDSVTQNKHQSTRQIYETLVVYDDDGNLIPWLAESWEYADDCTINFKLREGVKFHNGDELKASDVIFTLNRLVKDNTVAAMQVNKVDFSKTVATGDYTFTLVTFEPYAIQVAMAFSPSAPRPTRTATSSKRRSAPARIRSSSITPATASFSKASMITGSKASPM